MAHIDDLISRVRATADHIKPATLAREAGLSVNALRGMHSEKWNPRADTLKKLERFLEGHSPAPKPRRKRTAQAERHGEAA